MITMNGKYQTRDGRAVRILATDVKDPGWPIVGVLTDTDGNESMQSWTADGQYMDLVASSNADLIPVPTKHEGWFVTSHVQAMAQFTTKEEAAQFAKRNGGTVAHCFWED